jgi:hypothetical protein
MPCPFLSNDSKWRGDSIRLDGKFPETATGITDHNFTAYGVLLASYGIIPALQGLAGPIKRLAAPADVVRVCVDVSTSAPINPAAFSARATIL